MVSAPNLLEERRQLQLAIKYSSHPPAHWVHTQVWSSHLYLRVIPVIIPMIIFVSREKLKGNTITYCANAYNNKEAQLTLSISNTLYLGLKSRSLGHLCTLQSIFLSLSRTSLSRTFLYIEPIFWSHRTKCLSISSFSQWKIIHFL